MKNFQQHPFGILAPFFCRNLAPTLLLCFLAALQSREVMAIKAPPRTPYEFRAAFIVEIAKRADWPATVLPTGATQFVIGILGEDPFGKDINIIKPETVKDRPVTIKYFKTVQEVEGCQVLFISSSERKTLAQTLKTLENSSIMTVAEMEDFTDQGGMVKLVTENKTLGFEINLKAAEKAKLNFSAQLLKLAKITRK